MTESAVMDQDVNPKETSFEEAKFLLMFLPKSKIEPSWKT